MNRRSAGVIAIIVVAAATAASVAIGTTLHQSISRANEIAQPNKTTATSIQSFSNSSSAANNNSASSPIANASDTKTPINIVSSQSALPFVQRWVAQYNLEHNKGIATVTYSADADNATKSAKSISEFLSSNSADLAIVGGVQATNSNNSTTLLPVSPHAVAIVYNIPGFPDIPSGLKLDRPTLARVLTGNITYWDDASLKSLNPDLNLPHEKIIVVHPSKEESSTDLLAQYMFPDTNGSKILWSRSSMTAPSVGELSTLVQQTPNSFGFVDYAYAIQSRMTYGALENSQGKFVSPSTNTISSAIQNGTRVGNFTNLSNVTGNNFTSLVGSTVPTINVAHIGNESSYPAVGLYYAALASSRGNASDSNSTDAAVRDFARWTVGAEGQQILQDAQYPSLYDSNLLRAYLNEKVR